ncbi:exocyst complex component 7 isoform X2 [Hemicordylus capensis]|uniref:exocyst complex component 7 isoform X2 n=1 Tax=Hemicordylus capensis TaxID=884348 RepID=UPI00230201CE|nr:exocyst complex component 7 isoform X2 [Hemicordylus capensis]
MIPTEEASGRRREIEEKLKQEEETLSFIRDSLEKSDQLTKNMVSILSSFESRLMRLENSIIPVHKQTENLQRLQENVEKTLFCLDHVISYYHVAKDTEKIIREGPTGRLEEYLGCMAKIQKAVEYFQDNNPDSPELNRVKLLFEKGKESLESEFRSLMTRNSKPVPPILILDLISLDEEMETQEDVTLEHLPEGVLQDIIRISGWLVEYGRNQEWPWQVQVMCYGTHIRSNSPMRQVQQQEQEQQQMMVSSSPVWSFNCLCEDKQLPAGAQRGNLKKEHRASSCTSIASRESFVERSLRELGHNCNFMNVYYQIRSSQLDRSIKGLKEHFRKNSSSSGVPYSPAIQNKRKDTPTKKPIKRPVLIPGTIRKAQNLLKQYSQQCLDGKKGASNLIPMEGRDDMLDIEIDAYIHCVSAFIKLAQSEYQLLTEIIPEHHQKKTFDSLIQESLDNLIIEGDNIVSAARKAIIRHDYSAVLTIFPILKHLKQTKPEFDQVLQGTAASTKNKLPSLITSMETTGAKALEDFADNIKNNPDKEYNMPKDGTVHELTSNAILFLQQLLDFQETAGAMLASQVLGDTYNIPLDPRETSSSASSYSSEFSRRLLSTYICKVLGNLQLNLLSKSKVYEDPALSAIFLHNNYNYILKSLEKSELIQLVAVTQKTAERSYREHIEQQILTYQRSWLKVSDYILEKNLPVFQPGVKLKDKERQMIKERFKGFNDGLEELCKIQKAWAIPDTEQRDKIRQAQKTIVQETYAAFLNRYGNVPFTKNPEKYIKYRVEQVGEMIEKLFDTSA